MAKTKLALYDGDQISFFKADQLAVSALSYIKNSGGNLVLQAESGAKLSFKSSLLLDSGLIIGSTGSSSTLTLGNSGDIINLNASGVTYNIGTLTGSPIFTGNITTQGSGTNTFSGTTNFTGNVNFNGTTVELNVTNLTVDDKNIELGSVTTPTDITADGGGITLKGATDKTIVWDNANDNWTSSEHWNIATGKLYKINNVSLLGYVDPYTVSYQNFKITNTSATNTTRFVVEGLNGQLFSIVDDLSDSLLSVNDISGLPILEVFAADKVVMGKFGSNTLVVNSESVGIGTATPISKLHINAGTATNTYLTFQGTAGGQGFGINLLDSGGSSYIRILNDNNNLRVQTNTADHVLNIKNAGSVGIGTESQHASNRLSVNGALAVGTSYVSVAGPANGLIVQGNFGLGISSPTSKLNVAGIGRFVAVGDEAETSRGINLSPAIHSGTQEIYTYGSSTSKINAYNTGTDLINAGIELNVSSGFIALSTAPYGSGATEKMRILSDGKVGIGNSSPTYKLDVSGNSRFTDTLNVTGGGANITRSSTATALTVTQNSTGNILDIFDGGTNVFTVLDGGNVGLGITTPPQQLSISRNFDLPLTTYNSGNPYGIIFKDGNPFIHDFSYSAENNNQITPEGRNLFIGINSGNFLVGQGASAVEHSSDNIGLGAYTLQYIDLGFSNVAIGTNALSQAVECQENIAIGKFAMNSLIYDSYTNIAIGVESLNTVEFATYNIAIGKLALSGMISPNMNIGIGINSLSGGFESSNNVGIGHYTFDNIGMSSGFNIALGNYAGSGLGTGLYNIFIGDHTGSISSEMQENILIGKAIENSTGSTNNFLSIGNLIFGTGVDGTGTTLATGKVGIKNNTPVYTLDVAGDINISAGSSYRINGEPLTNEAIIKKITQNAHGLSVGNAVRLNSSGVYVKAQADTPENSEVIGIIQEVVDSNTFKIVFAGIVTAGVPVATAGTVLFLSDTTAGGLTATEPTAWGRVSKPIAVVASSGSSMIFVNMRGMVITEDDAIGEFFDVTNISSDYSANLLDNIILCDTTNGNVTINLPTAVDNQGKVFSLKKIDSTFYDVIITPVAGQLIEGDISYKLEAPGEYVQIVSNNLNWLVIAD